jgi:hypothetical protein
MLIRNVCGCVEMRRRLGRLEFELKRVPAGN